MPPFSVKIQKKRTRMEQNNPDPASTYINIYNKLVHYKLMGQKMPAAESALSFGQLMAACSQLIAENERLRKAVAISDQIAQELEIEMAVKDIELFNFTTQQEKTQEDDD